MLRVLHEDNHLLVVDKPAGVATMGARPGVESVFDLAARYLKEKYQKPGNVYLGVVSRLDAPVTGVLPFARTSKAASRLSRVFRDRAVDKHYLALVEGEADESEEPVVHYVWKDERNRRMVASPRAMEHTQRAELRYRVLHSTSQASLLAVRLLTGRKHQIRVQLAKLGHPVVGDSKYGARTWGAPGIALHCWRLALDHPVRRDTIEFCAPHPKVWETAIDDAGRSAIDAALREGFSGDL